MTDIMLIDNISTVYKKMSHAAMRAGRNPEDIKLIAVTKTLGLERIKEAIDAGLRIFGESKVQEAKDKISNLKFFASGRLGRLAEESEPARGGQISNSKIEWHLIGHLQKNKVKTAVDLFDVIHSVDSAELAEMIDKQAELIGKKQKIFI